MDEITEKNEQMHEKSSSAEQIDKESSSEESGYRQVAPWISAEKKVNSNSTDPVDILLLRIQKKVRRNFWQYWIPLEHLYVSPVFVIEDKPILFSIHQEHQEDSIEPSVMEIYKIQYLKNFVNRTRTTVKEVTQGLSYWPEPTILETFIVGGCFIIELFLKNEEGAKDSLFNSERVLQALSRDLIVPSNQLPFFVLHKLYKQSGHSVNLNQDGDPHNKKQLTKLALNFLKRIVPNQKLDHTLVDDIYNEIHDFTTLTSLVYNGLRCLRPQANNNGNSNTYKEKKDQEKKDGLDKSIMVKSATELREFGLEFKMIETDNFINIKFENKGVLEIPCLDIRHGMPCSIKALFMHEQSLPSQRKPLNDYLWFMNSLVKSPNDIQLLRQEGIIHNLSELIDDVAIHKFLKEFHQSLTISPTDLSYIQVCRDLNSHCKHRRNRWMAKLKRDYFNSPWAFISFFAASLLLILAAVQTVFSIASYYKRG